MRRPSVIGLAAILLGIGVFTTQMFVGLNDESEYSNPWYLQVARWFAVLLLIAGLATVAAAAAKRRHR